MEATKTGITDKTIFVLSICALLYLSFLHVNSYYFKVESIALGVVQELITIPIIMGQLVLLFVAWKRFKRTAYSVKTYAFASFVVLTALNCYVFVIFLLG